jgi:DNA polymerase elongation subunit (family B)
MGHGVGLKGVYNIKILHLDIETAPNKVYAWGLWNQNIGINQIVESGYTLCWAAKWHGVPGMMFEREGGTGRMLDRMWDLLDEADVVCHYNGTKFDMPTLNKEFVLHGMEPPSSYKQIDLLRTCRSQFRFPSNKLDYVAQELGLGSKTKHKGMELWDKVMQNDPKAWAVMEKYNKQDVTLLERLYKRLRPWIKNHPNVGLYEGKAAVCRVCGSKSLHKNGFEYTSVGKYQRYRCNSCGSPNRGATNSAVKKVIR